MAAPAVLKIDIIANAQKAIDAFQDTGKAAGGITDSVKSIGKVVGPALGTAAVVSFGKASIEAATESAVANARLEQVFRSMGDATGEAAKASEDYASALSKRIGVDDEIILAGQAQLATFGDVSSAVARQAGIFDRATAAGADLAAAGFGSIESNAVQLGKALQDPTKGMTALAKSGVTFTDAQKDQIKAMQESGDLLGAQQIVLGAVEQQVKGTAEATVTSQQKAALAFGEVQEQLGGKLLPVVNTVMDVFSRYSGILLPLAAIIGGIILATKVWTAVTTAFNIVMGMNPIVLVVLAIGALVAAVILAYQKVDWFRAFIDSAFQAIVGAFNWLKNAASAVFDWVSANWPLLLAILLGPFGIALGFIIKNFDTIMDVIKGVIAWITNNWPLLLAILTGPIGIAVLLITRNWDTLMDAAKAMVNWVSDRFSDLVGFISRIAQTISGVMGSIVEAIKGPINAATEVYNWVVDKFNALVSFLGGLKDSIANTIGGIADAIKGPLNAVIRAWNAIQFDIPGIDVGPVHWGGFTVGTPDIPTLATGGRVMRTGMALVHEGETFSGVGRSTGGGTTINVTVNAGPLGADAPEVQKAVVNALRGYVGRNGPLGAPIVATGG